MPLSSSHHCLPACLHACLSYLSSFLPSFLLPNCLLPSLPTPADLVLFITTSFLSLLLLPTSFTSRLDDLSRASLTQQQLLAAQSFARRTNMRTGSLTEYDRDVLTRKRCGISQGVSRPRCTFFVFRRRFIVRTRDDRCDSAWWRLARPLFCCDTNSIDRQTVIN
ncbi:hypothetical protein E2C01_051135 [Portunus trituberculatus]|uniref:Uncharacterized protein n=1 Tax=Portunus trituberculatus TaxID=210409 RepID=A0A5B7GA64_PORTR|nr:hypothetical protein [Portunus trituberculatus]